MKKVLIDTDPGIDDAQALAYAFAHPDLQVIALTTIFGNVSVELATANALRLCDLCNVDAPVARGADRPLVIKPNQVADFVHGKNGFGGVELAASERKADNRNAANTIIDSIRQHPGELTIIAVGPLTNLAAALQLDPDISQLVSEVVVMGGAFKTSGNVSEFAEANIWNDPHAAEIVFNADWPLTVHGLDVTHQVSMSREYLQSLADTSPKCGGFIAAASGFYCDFYEQTHGRKGCCPHDLLAVAYSANPHWYQKQPCTEMAVETDGEQIGRTTAGTQETGNKAYVTSVDVAALLADYKIRIASLP